MIPQTAQSKAALIRTIRQAVNPPARPLPVPLRSLFGREFRTPLPVLQAVIAAVADKLYLARVRNRRKTVEQQIGRILTASEYQLRLLFAAVVRDGTGYLMIVTDPKPALVFVPAYDGTIGAFSFTDGAIGIVGIADTGERLLTVFQTGTIERYREQSQQWVRTETERWPYPIPVIEFGDGKSFVEPLIQLQDDLNLAVFDLLAANRAVGFPVRYILGSASSDYLTNLFGQPLIDATGAPIRRTITLEPGAFVRISEPNAEIGQLSASPPDATTINTLLELFSLLTGVPLFFFKGTLPSGAAIQAAEQRLNATVERYQSLLSDPIRRVCATLAALVTNRQSDEEEWSIEWYPPQIETEELRAQRVKWVVEAVNAGLMSKEEAVRTIHPDWPEERIIEEVAKLNGSPEPGN